MAPGSDRDQAVLQKQRVTLATPLPGAVGRARGARDKLAGGIQTRFVKKHFVVRGFVWRVHHLTDTDRR